MRPRRQETVFQGVGLTEPEVPLAVESEEPEPPEEFPPETWLLMDGAPQDGTLLQVKMDFDAVDEQAVFAFWRSTTMFDRELRRWRRIGYWADPVTKQQLHGEPLVYRLASAAPILGMLT